MNTGAVTGFAHNPKTSGAEVAMRDQNHDFPCARTGNKCDIGPILFHAGDKLRRLELIPEVSSPSNDGAAVALRRRILLTAIFASPLATPAIARAAASST